VTLLRHAGILCLLYLAVVVQTSVVTDLPPMGRPFLPALMLMVMAAWCHPVVSILWAGFMGFVLDGISTERLGIQLGLAAILALGLQLLRPIWRRRGPVSMTVCTLVVALFWRALSPMTCAVLSGRVVDPHVTLNSALRDGAATAVVALVVFVAGRALIRGGGQAEIEAGRPAGRVRLAAR
jgi:rod shape-determining protein MreD